MVYGNVAFSRFLSDHGVARPMATKMSHEAVRLPRFEGAHQAPLMSAENLLSEVKAGSSNDCNTVAFARRQCAGRGERRSGRVDITQGIASGFAEDRAQYVKLPSEVQLLIRQQKGSLTCKTCGKGFERRSNLNKHIRHVHACERLYLCKTCGHRFGQKSSIDKHLRVVHGMGTPQASSKPSASSCGRQR